MLKFRSLAWTLQVGAGQSMLHNACWNQAEHVGLACWIQKTCVGHHMLDLDNLRWTSHVRPGQLALDITCWNRTRCVGHHMLEPDRPCWTLSVQRQNRIAHVQTGLLESNLVLGGCMWTPPEPDVARALSGFERLANTLKPDCLLTVWFPAAVLLVQTGQCT